MNARSLLNLFLLVLVVGLGLFIFYAQDKTDDPVIRINGPAIDRIHSITIQRRDLGDFYLEKKDQQWWMTNPYKVLANPVPINSLLDLSQAISHSRFSAKDKNLADYGLSPAKASIAFNGEEYIFGNIEHINKRRYVLKGNTVHLTTDLFYHRLKTNTEAFISPRLIPDKSTITALKLPGLQLEQSAQGQWLISGSDSSQQFSSDAIQTLIDHWHHKQAIQLLPVQNSEKAKTVQLVFADNSVITFLAKITDNYLILIRNDLGLQYKLPAAAADDLLTLK